MTEWRCKCPNCGYEWTYTPLNGRPKRYVSCPRCRTTFSLAKHCAPCSKK